jgi:excisionase family DNA binding protein
MWKDATSGKTYYPSGMTEDQFYTVSEAAKVLNITNRRVRQLAQEGRIEGHRSEVGWKLFRSSVHTFRDEKRASSTPSEEISWPQEAREALQRVNALERELGRFEGRLELEAIARSTLEAQLQREKERADAERERADAERQRVEELEAELREARKSWWRKLFSR